MNRSAKAHRSTKIPNVKLRPAQRGSGSLAAAASSSFSSKRSRQRDQLLDDREDAAHFRRLRDDGHDHGAHMDADFSGNAAYPLKGAIISITGLSESKATLTQYARELGARVEGNLTEDVTHLIADRPGSEKYRFALELGMHIINPDWILQVREAWLAGQDVDAEELERHHQLPALSNTTICFSAVAPLERRSLSALAKELGATVSDELRFDGSITHLVSATADPSASRSVEHLLTFLDRSRHGRNGSREQAASRILAVRPEWLTDCQQAGGCLSEQTYSIFVKLPERDERTALIEEARKKLPSPFVRQQEPVTVPLQSPFIASGRSKLALAGVGRDNGTDKSHAEDAEDDQPIAIGSRQKAAAAGDKSFESILTQLRNNQTSSSTSTSRNSVKSHDSASTISHPQLNSAPSDPTSISTSAHPSALAPASTSTTITRPKTYRNGLLGMSRANSFSPAPPATTSAPLNVRKNTTKLVTLPQHGDSAGSQAARKGNEPCFHGKSFKIRYSNPQREKLLQNVLKSNGATLLPLASSTSPDFMLVEPDISAADLQAIEDADIQPVLHIWIEYCLYHEVFVEPTEYFAALPARVPLPLPEGDQLRLLLLGLEVDSPELHHAEQLVTEMGGTIAKQIKGEILTHVVCATKESLHGRRAQRARSCGVPVVGLEFLIKARQTGRILPPPVPIATAEQSPSALTGSSSSNSAPSNAERDQDAEDDDQPPLPLAGCTISRSKALAAQSVMLERKVLHLGACWQAQPNELTTHLLHWGPGQPRESKDLDRFAFIVHPTWLDKCLDEGIRVDETLFPFSLNPAKSLHTVLSNSDGSASGNLLSQASQSVNQRNASSQNTQRCQPAQAGLAPAAKPWNRSISADAGGSSTAQGSVVKGGEGDRKRTRAHSAENVAAHQGPEPEILDLSAHDDAVDADITLSGQAVDLLRTDDDDAAPAPSSQTLIEGEEVEADGPIRDVRGTVTVLEKSEHKKTLDPEQTHALTSAKAPMPSADKVIEFLQSREGKGSRKKSRAPPRARKQRSDEFKVSAGPTNGKRQPEQVLEAQARLDAQRADEAAAQGFSLGMEKGVDLSSASQANSILQQSMRVVWEDDAEKQNRAKIAKMIEPKQAAGGVGDHEEHPAAAPEVVDLTQDVQMDDATDAAQNETRKRRAEDTFGAGRRGRHAWENRNSESPTKRPVVRRQPLARR